MNRRRGWLDTRLGGDDGGSSGVNGFDAAIIDTSHL